jgi:hypothetical protein
MIVHSRKSSSRLLLAGLLSSTLACGLEEVGEGGEGDEIPPPVQAAFNESCATSSSCHAAGSNLVVLAAPESSSILTTGGSGGPFVTLGDLENSYIAQKILGGSSIIGAQMPPSPQSDNDDVNTALIVGWIAGVPIEGEDSGDGDPSCFIDAPIPTAPSFGADIWPILQNRCGTMGCHANLSAPLMPDEATAYVNLVGMPAAMAMANYVEPSDPDGSYLWHKIAGTFSMVQGGGGSTMPFGGQLCTTELQAIYAWILADAVE